MPSTQKMSGPFQKLMVEHKEGLIVKPLLSAYLIGQQQPEFTVTFAKRKERKPDGWFHPSTHPLWTERQLYYYVTEGDRLISDPFSEVGMMSITIGTVLHSFLQAIMVDLGIMEPDSVEAIVKDEATRAKGAVDGFITMDGVDAVWDLKTTNPHALSGLEDLDLDQFAMKYPRYYAQQQEYMRLSGKPLSIVTMITTASPWRQCEFHIPYNPQWGKDMAEKYQRVIACVEAGTPPAEECCLPGMPLSKKCQARVPCPNGEGTTVKVKL